MLGSEFIKFKLMRPGAVLPTRGTPGSGAFDFWAPEDGFLDPGEKRLIDSGIAHDMPGAFAIPIFFPPAWNPNPSDLDMAAMTNGTLPFKLQGILFDRSGLGGKKGIRLSFACLIDNDYRGEIKLSLENHSVDPFSWRAGDRLCQIAYVLMYAGEAGLTETLTDTHRGEGGFGSTGR
jgi:dUTPase